MLRRVLQTLGLTAALVSLASYWVLASAGSARPALARPNLLAPPGTLPTFSLVIAGRDLQYCGHHRLCPGEERWGKRTDTILFARVTPERTDVVSIPRDTRLTRDGWTFKANAAFARGGTRALQAAVEDLLGVNVDYVAVANVDLVQRLVDALGGIDVHLAEPMRYTDEAAKLYIDLPAGDVHLDGERALGYLRFRNGHGSDYARMDRTKEVLARLLDKARSPAVVRALPALAAGLMNDVETNVDLELVRRVLPHAGSLSPRFSTLPTLELRGSSYLEPDRRAIEAQLGPALGRPAAEGAVGANGADPEVAVVDASGVPGLGAALAAHLGRAGLPVAAVETRDAAGLPTAILRAAGTPDLLAGRLALALGVPVSVPYDLPATASGAPVVIQLGRDAALRYAALVEQARATRP